MVINTKLAFYSGNIGTIENQFSKINMCNAGYCKHLDAILGETILSRGKVAQPATLLKTEFGLKNITIFLNL